MLSTLVDNSTLTAVQRLIGDIPVALSFSLEGDVSAYDNYLQALLLYDNVASIDDYKADHKEGRHQRFREVRFITPRDAEYQKATESSVALTDDIMYSVRGGSLSSGPMKDFLEALQLHVIPAWYMASSSWYLNLRILADESGVELPKYGALMNIIQSQTVESERSRAESSRRLKVIDRFGKLITSRPTSKKDVEKSVYDFAAGLNWITQRTAFYLLMSERLESAVSLHPIRHTFAGQYMAGSLMPSLPKDARRKTIDFFKAGVESIREESDQIIGANVLAIRLPFFAAWAVGRTGNPKDGYDHVLQVRGSSAALKLRQRFREIESYVIGQNVLEHRRAIADLRAAFTQDLVELKKAFTGTGRKEVPDVSLDVMSLSPSIPLSPILNKAKRLLPKSDARAVALLRNISNDMLAIPSLGQVSDRFGRSRKIRKGTDFVPDRTRVEDAKWANTTSHWKRPL